MFVFEPDYTFEWPVTVKYPTAGGEDVRAFTAVFRLPEDELDLYQAPKDSTIHSVVEAVRDRLAEYWVGWNGIKTPDGEDLPFSPEMRARLLRQSPIRQAVDHALSDAITGIRKKN
ncbi:MAG: hypothetical protein ACPGSW_00435 [Phaeobacter italicus]